MRIISTVNCNSNPSSPILTTQRNDSPVSQEDEEILSIVKQGDSNRTNNIRQCDSVLHEVEGAGKIKS